MGAEIPGRILVAVHNGTYLIKFVGDVAVRSIEEIEMQNSNDKVEEVHEDADVRILEEIDMENIKVSSDSS